MKLFLFFVIVSTCFLANAQDHFEIYYEETENGFRILTDNDEYCPISAQIDLTLENLESSNGNNKIVVIPARKKRHEITQLTVIDRSKQMRLGISTVFNFGNHFLDTYDRDFSYYLPFAKGDSFWLSQGYNGKVSHQNEYALDFEMPIGTKIYAARAGVVVDIEEGYSKSCTGQDCAKYNNYIVLYHSDGTFAEYTHIQKNGAKVDIGDQVTIGQHIGYSGNVGWATGPHLHFIVFYQRIKSRKTLPTKFLIDSGNIPVQLTEKVKYTKQY